MYRVFVLMPFDEAFGPVFENFIKPTFEDVEGVEFQITRADDIENQRNILNDIVVQIATSDLVLADLTGSNPNVFYELGIAHAMGRPVVLLTQDISDVPFDLHAYRILQYSLHFVEMETAKAGLRQLAQKFAKGEIEFSNPVMDFLPGDLKRVNLTLRRDIDTTEDDRGFLDHVVAIVDGFGKLGTIAKAMTTSMNQNLTQPMEQATLELNRLGLDKPGVLVNPRAVQGITRRLAKRVSTFGDHLATANKEYEGIAADTEYSLELVASFVLSQERPIDPSVDAQFEQLRTFRDTATNARDTCAGLADQADALPRMERRLNRALEKQSWELRGFSDNLDRTIASVDRALNIWDSRSRAEG